MQRFEIYRPVMTWLFALTVLITTAATAFAQDQDEPAEEASEPASSGSQSLSRSLVWTGTGQHSLKQMFPEGAIWLELEENDRALGLFYPETALPARGAVVVLADEGETAASGITGALARALASRGWAVLALGLESPSPVLQQILARPVSVARSGGQDSEDPEANAMMIDVMDSENADDLESRYRSHISESLEAAVAALVERGYETPALLGVGRAGIHVANRFLAGGDASALVWVAPEFYPVDRAGLPGRLESLSGPLLELYPLSADGNESLWSVGNRLRRAGVKSLERQPISWYSPPTEALGDSVASRVAAWLNSL